MKILLSIIVVVGVLAYGLFIIYYGILFRLIPHLKTSTLKALFGHNVNALAFQKASEELVKRGEDMTFTFPIFLDLALSGDELKELIGRGSLQRYFRDKLTHIDLTGKQMKPEAREQLQELRRKLDEIMSAK